MPSYCYVALKIYPNREGEEETAAPAENHHDPTTTAPRLEADTNDSPGNGGTEEATTDGTQTSTGYPSPNAKATAPHEPEPPPRKTCPTTQRAGGTEVEGNATNKAPAGPPARTKRSDLAAKGPRPAPVARKTPASGNASRTKASTPRAHPTRTGAEENAAAKAGTNKEAPAEP